MRHPSKLHRLQRELNAARAAFADEDYIAWLENEIAFRSFWYGDYSGRVR